MQSHGSRRKNSRFDDPPTGQYLWFVGWKQRRRRFAGRRWNPFHVRTLAGRTVRWPRRSGRTTNRKRPNDLERSRRAPSRRPTRLSTRNGGVEAASLGVGSRPPLGRTPPFRLERFGRWVDCRSSPVPSVLTGRRSTTRRVVAGPQFSFSKETANTGVVCVTCHASYWMPPVTAHTNPLVSGGTDRSGGERRTSKRVGVSLRHHHPSRKSIAL